MGEIAHLIGNGDSSRTFDHNTKEPTMVCNLPPFPVNAFATGIVDFKMMKAIQDESLVVPGMWVLGHRPHEHLKKHPGMYLKHSKQIKDFYLTIPKYAIDLADGDVGKAYTNFSCGHMSMHYMANKLKPDELHMYGFDSLFDFNLRSCSDLYLMSDRNPQSTLRLSNNWRAIWPHQFAEFPNTNFILHSHHKDIKVETPDNVEIFCHK